MEKQTAIEWLVSKLEPHLYPDFELVDLINQAKEMEKEQMIEFSQEVFRCRYNQIHQSLSSIADDIYYETYKNK